jgi:tryptophan synthase alpha chain
VGLGVSNGAQAHEIARYADGVIVGSALVRTLERADVDGQAAIGALRALVADLSSGVHR